MGTETIFGRYYWAKMRNSIIVGRTFRKMGTADLLKHIVTKLENGALVGLQQ
jgi:hypothetical protein